MNGQKFYKIDNHPLRFRVNLTDSFTLIIITNQPTAKGEQRRAKFFMTEYPLCRKINTHASWWGL